MITKEKFIASLGYEPEQDDLERCNCDKVGQIGHFWCGRDDLRNKPNFVPDPPMKMWSHCAGRAASGD